LAQTNIAAQTTRRPISSCLEAHMATPGANMARPPISPNEGVISFGNSVISFDNPARMFYLLLQPLCNRPTTITLSGLARQGRGNVQTNPDRTFAMSVWATKVWQQFPPARLKITLMFHADFKCVYKPCLPQ
jgi:hypothetical protein